MWLTVTPCMNCVHSGERTKVTGKDELKLNDWKGTLLFTVLWELGIHCCKGQHLVKRPNPKQWVEIRKLTSIFSMHSELKHTGVAVGVCTRTIEIQFQTQTWP